MERRNAWAIEYGLADGPVFMYAGSLGLNHDPRLLVELARSLPDVTVVVISDGSGMDFVRSEAARDGLANLRLLPVQPYEQLSAALATADVLLALIEREAAQYSVPSKVLTYLCAGRPILASVPPGNLAAEVIRQAGAGYVVDTHDEAGWLACARDLATDADLRGELGRRARGYAEETFAIDRIGDRFEVLLQRAIATVGAAEGSQA
jgi:glycosyltransferase involved in cell wall biosynthesis